MVVISSNKILVKTAFNGYDETDDRLYLSQILMALWSDAGKSKSALRYLAWENVNNDPITDALEGARDFLDLGENDDFILDVNSANEDIWETFELTTPRDERKRLVEDKLAEEKDGLAAEEQAMRAAQEELADMEEELGNLRSKKTNWSIT
ncbi:hypothetical protein QIS74_04880 [Colletotrichum tabaci]|uniref:Uncharacterized protein n=1 Tax=Colletotrichum tabaci TaxID=1209068 RepID=A0AAV9TGW7_9PEZI